MMDLKNWLATLSIAAVLTTGAASMASAQDKVMISELSWPNARVIANVIKVIITDKLGGKAEIVPSTNAVIFKAMDRGKGDIDVHPDVWLPNQQALVDEYVGKKGTVALNKKGYSGFAGFCVPSYTAKEKGIKSMFDLATPEGAKHFDSDGDGKGEIWIGPEAWTNTKMRMVKIRDYGIGTFMETTHEEEAFAYARVATAIQKKESIVFSCYQPHYMFKLHDLTLLEEPPHDAENYKFVLPATDPDWFAKSKIKSADAPKTVNVAYSRSLETREPAIAAFLSNIAMETDTVSEWTHSVVVEKIDPADVARTWVKANSAIVDGWLGLN